jgi:ornithine cyclodeaminase/alanine dehydrogenase-like protein (mu-crystallin family)
MLSTPIPTTRSCPASSCDEPVTDVLEYLDAAEIARRLTPAEAVAAIEQVLRDGFDPATDPARSIVDVPAGQLLLMPSSSARAAGVKLATVAPDNARHGRPRIQALYVLLDAQTLTPQALLDGTALTTLRTPAVSIAAVRPALSPRPDVLVFGAGPQGRGHVATLDSVLGGLGRVRYVVRDPAAATVDAPVLRLGDGAVDDALRAADVVVCATNARTPLFDSTLLAASAVVMAVGVHEPDARELDAALFGRARVIVEDRATALREAGDVVLAIADGALTPDALGTMRDVVTGVLPPARDRPIVFKSTGMSWEDLAVARAVVAADPGADTDGRSR